MDPTIAATVAQFGVAGLIGWMWLAERRSAGEREQQLRDLHQRVQADAVSLGALLKALDDNTRAIVTLEGTQRRLVDAFERAGLGSGPAGGERSRAA